MSQQEGYAALEASLDFILEFSVKTAISTSAGKEDSAFRRGSCYT